MKKVLINTCFGGFFPSLDLVYLAFVLGYPFPQRHVSEYGVGLTKKNGFVLETTEGYVGNAEWAILKINADYYISGMDMIDDHHCRSHPALIKAVEILGLERAGGRSCKLRVVELNDNDLYRISDYDGRESVEVLDAVKFCQGHVFADALPDNKALPVFSPV